MESIFIKRRKFKDTHCKVSKFTPRIPELSQPINMNDICPRTKQIPTNTFHARSGLGPGLNLLITNPDNRNPNTIPTSDIGPVNSNKATYITSVLLLLNVSN